MRIRIALSCLVASCATGLDPASTPVLVEQHASPEAEPRAEASLSPQALAA